MDFGLTDEQALLRQTAEDFVASVCPAEKAKQWDDEYTYPPELIAGFADMGWLGLPLPEDVGGGGGTANELAIIGEELGRASLDIAQCYALTLMAAMVIEQFGTAAMRADLLPRIIAGERRLSIGMSEPDAGSDVAALRTTAIADGDDYVVNGQKMWCTGAGLPNTQILAYVRTDPGAEKKHQGMSAVLIDPTTAGVELRQIPTLARHILGTYEVFLTDVRVSRENLVGPEHDGWRVMLSGIDLERVLISGGYVGAAQATLDEALEHAKTRRQFGRPVGEFQALTHALADLQTEIDCARLLVQRAAWLHSVGASCGREASMAKLKGSETYVAAARLGMQVCAGMGFSTESVMSFRWRESIVAPISGGTSQIQRNAIARSMGLRGY
jgi:alkylation response protein AidB-like acyl-CoA dehydrogenase